jgi:hypothetical protein
MRALLLLAVIRFLNGADYPAVRRPQTVRRQPHEFGQGGDRSADIESTEPSVPTGGWAAIEETTVHRSRGLRASAMTATLLVGLLLGACESDDAADPAATEVTTPSTDAAVLSSESATTPTAAVTPPGPTTSTTVAAASDTAAATPPPATEATSGTPATAVRITAPATDETVTTSDTLAHAGATIVIEAADMSLTQTGGTCSIIDGTTYIFTGQDAPNAMSAVIMWNGDAAAPVDAGLTWQLDPDHAAGSAREDFSLAVAADSKSGTFVGTAVVGKAGVTGYRQAITGTFTCDS